MNKPREEVQPVIDEYFAQQREIHGTGNINIAFDDLKRISTCHLVDPSPILALLDKGVSEEMLTLQDIKALSTPNSGIIHFEISGNIHFIQKSVLHQEIRFSINPTASYWDLKTMSPNVKPTIVHDGPYNMWHLHPWNSNPRKDLHGGTLPNFFSAKDLDVMLTYPHLLNIIFNAAHHSNLKYPEIYVMKYKPEISDVFSTPTKDLRNYSEHFIKLERYLQDMMNHYSDHINWTEINTTMLQLGIQFDQMMAYDHAILLQKIKDTE